MQNTMGLASWEKNEKKEKEENYIKKGGKGLKMHLFGV